LRIPINVGLGLGFAIALAVPAANLAGEGRDWVLQVGVGLVACGAALLRERHRAWAAVVGMAVCAAAGLLARVADLPREPGPASTLALLVLVGSAVRVLPWQGAVGIAAGVVVMPAGWLTASSSGASAAQVEAGIVGWCAALGVGLWLRFLDERQHTATETVRREQRLMLARELHDVVAHHITGIVLQAQAARIVARKQPEALDETLAGIDTAGTDALAAMRRVIGLLRDTDDGAPTALGPDQLAELVRRFDGHGPTIRLTLPAENVSLPPEITSTVYRIVQESLTNIARHAPQARSATVEVVRDRHGVTVQIADDGPPCAHRHPHRNGFGLVGMRERVEALGGTLRAGPGPDAGWSVHATLPVPAGDRVGDRR
jgi:signal transduction histidine kinase